MKWSWKIGTFAGIAVHMHATFLLLLLWIALSHWMQSGSFLVTTIGVAFTLSLFLCVVLHEYGHALTARRFGIATKDITLLPIGGIARLERMPDKPNQELWVALAGPAVNLVLAAVLALYLVVTGHFEPLRQIGFTHGIFLERLLLANLFLVGFNLIPAFPMDGGRVLRALLAKRTDYARATRIAASIGQGLAFLFGLVGLLTNPFLIFIALFVWIGASQEAAMVETKFALDSVSVKDAMISDFRTLAPHDRLTDAVKLILSGWQQDFPVLDEGSAIGMLLRSDMIATLAKGETHASVERVMRRDFPVASPVEPLQSAFIRLEQAEAATLPVIDRGRLVGLMTLENMTEYIMVRAALTTARRKGHTPLNADLLALTGRATN
ncbi:MAG TPA: site-2 protease family protein [Terriglobales bacterium]|nr:site-2 protease family protein [Terriglobales bacterium]